MINCMNEVEFEMYEIETATEFCWNWKKIPDLANQDWLIPSVFDRLLNITTSLIMIWRKDRRDLDWLD